MCEYIDNEDMNGGRCSFLSAELRDHEPEAYAEKHLGDLILFEAPGEILGGLVDRWFVEPLMKQVHRFWIPGKVS